jgi:hypothetical protein
MSRSRELPVLGTWREADSGSLSGLRLVRDPMVHQVMRSCGVLPVTRHENVASLGMSTAGTEISVALATTS